MHFFRTERQNRNGGLEKFWSLWQGCLFLTVGTMSLILCIPQFKNSHKETKLIKSAGFGIFKQKPAPENTLCREHKKISFSFSSSRKVLVFKQDGSVQCPEEKCTQESCAKNFGMSPKEMAKNLKASGIRVFKAVKGSSPHGRGMAVCGAPTQNINIFYISAKQEEKALAKGFHSCIPKPQVGKDTQ